MFELLCNMTSGDIALLILCSYVAYHIMVYVVYRVRSFIASINNIINTFNKISRVVDDISCNLYNFSNDFDSFKNDMNDHREIKNNIKLMKNLIVAVPFLIKLFLYIKNVLRERVQTTLAPMTQLLSNPLRFCLPPPSQNLSQNLSHIPSSVSSSKANKANKGKLNSTHTSKYVQPPLNVSPLPVSLSDELPIEVREVLQKMLGPILNDHVDSQIACPCPNDPLCSECDNKKITTTHNLSTDVDGVLDKSLIDNIIDDCLSEVDQM